MSPDAARAGTIGLDARSLYLRRLALKALEGGGRGHIGSTLSLVEIMRVLYDEVLRFDAKDPQWADRDRCLLSKGHGCIALYAMLADKGFFPIDRLETFCRTGSILGGHPEHGKVPGVEFSTGALGHGLSVGVGMALAARLQKRASRVFVIMGDGEINEGSVWEAAMCASKHGLANLTAMIDYNKIQSYGPVDEVMPLEPLVDKWRSFGFAVREVNGHDVAALGTCFKTLPFETGRPSAIICHTVKGKGISFAENDPEWHHKSRLPADVTKKIHVELGVTADA